MICHNLPINCSHVCCNHVQLDRFSAQGHAAPLAARSSVTSDVVTANNQVTMGGRGLYGLYLDTYTSWSKEIQIVEFVSEISVDFLKTKGSEMVPWSNDF